MRDVVFMVRQAREYEELRHALRSLRNLPHGKVWIYGAEPKWLTGAVHVPVRQGAVSHVNTARIMLDMSRNRALSDEFYWFHDDMYVVEPCSEIPRLWRETWPNWRAGASQRRDPHGPAKTNATEAVMAAFGRQMLYCYELHVPMVMERDPLRRMVEMVRMYQPEALALVQKRSLYGNWVDYGGTQTTDVKFYRSTAADQLGQLASSSDLALGLCPAGRRIRELFSEPGPYEKPRELVDVSTKTRGVRTMAGHLAEKLS